MRAARWRVFNLPSVCTGPIANCILASGHLISFVLAATGAPGAVAAVLTSGGERPAVILHDNSADMHSAGAIRRRPLLWKKAKSRLWIPAITESLNLQIFQRRFGPYAYAIPKQHGVPFSGVSSDQFCFGQPSERALPTGTRLSVAVAELQMRPFKRVTGAAVHSSDRICKPRS